MRIDPEDVLTLGVTGATGAIGAMFVRQMVRSPNIEANVLVQGSSPFEDPSVHPIQGDLLDRSALDQIVSASDVIVHLAAQNPSIARRHDVASYINVNGLGTANVARLAGKHDKRIIYSSSVAVYELSTRTEGTFDENEELPGRRRTKEWLMEARKTIDQASIDWDSDSQLDLVEQMELFLREHPPPHNEDVYGLSKYLGEPWITDAPEGVVLRISDVYGPSHERGILHRCLQNLLKERTVLIDFQSRGLVSFVFIGDVIEALRRLVVMRLPATRTINVVNPAGVDVNMLAGLLREQASATGSRSRVRTKAEPGMRSRRQFSADVMKESLGVRSTMVEGGLKETIRYMTLSQTVREDYSFPELPLGSDRT